LLFASAFVAAVASWSLSAAAVEIALETRPISRRVLALYDGKAEGQPSATRIHQLVEMPLNHLGYEVVYHDVAAGPPGPDDLVGVRAVLTWFLEPLKEPRTVGEWLSSSVRLCRGCQAMPTKSPTGFSPSSVSSTRMITWTWV